jgi:hypothetical protein
MQTAHLASSPTFFSALIKWLLPAQAAAVLLLLGVPISKADTVLSLATSSMIVGPGGNPGGNFQRDQNAVPTPLQDSVSHTNQDSSGTWSGEGDAATTFAGQSIGTATAHAFATASGFDQAVISQGEAFLNAQIMFAVTGAPPPFPSQIPI